MDNLFKLGSIQSASKNFIEYVPNLGIKDGSWRIQEMVNLEKGQHYIL
jgi:hypothetical protein